MKAKETAKCKDSKDAKQIKNNKEADLKNVKEININDIYDFIGMNYNEEYKWQNYIASLRKKGNIIIIMPNYDKETNWADRRKCYEVPQHLLSQDLIKTLVPDHPWSSGFLGDNNPNNDVIQIGPTHICSASPTLYQESTISFEQARTCHRQGKAERIHSKVVDCLVARFLKRIPCLSCGHYTCLINYVDYLDLGAIDKNKIKSKSGGDLDFYFTLPCLGEQNRNCNYKDGDCNYKNKNYSYGNNDYCPVCHFHTEVPWEEFRPPRLPVDEEYSEEFKLRRTKLKPILKLFVLDCIADICILYDVLYNVPAIASLSVKTGKAKFNEMTPEDKKASWNPTFIAYDWNYDGPPIEVGVTEEE